jgi:signal peptidase I
MNIDVGAYIAILIIAGPFLVLVYAGNWALFKKAGRHGWEAIIPFYSSYVMLKISGRPGWWLLWFFLPFSSLIIAAGVTIDFIKSFGKFTFRDKAAAILLPFIYLPKWGFEKKTPYLGPSASPAFKADHPRSKKPSTPVEWTQGVLLAVLTAMFIRTFFIEAYVIPTPSMERSLLVGDYVLVSKLNYGARLPMTPVSLPFTHNTIPKFFVRSYWDGLELPYLRLPGFSSVKRGDVVVFNYPADTINNRPVDKRENFIKRCEGIPGDTVAIVDAQVFINGKLQPAPPGAQLEYNYVTNGQDVNPVLLQELNATVYGGSPYPSMTNTSADRLKSYSNIKSISPVIAPKGKSDSLNAVFPNFYPLHVVLSTKTPDYHWNADNFGPIIVPKKGWTVKLDSMNFPLYERCIEVYEHNKLEVKGRDIFINGKKTDTYTFKMNYYWVIGDNYHDSEDSRYWGFVPEDHIGGKAVLIYMSLDSDASLSGRIRWGRIFKLIK